MRPCSSVQFQILYELTTRGHSNLLELGLWRGALDLLLAACGDRQALVLLDIKLLQRGQLGELRGGHGALELVLAQEEIVELGAREQNYFTLYLLFRRWRGPRCVGDLTLYQPLDLKPCATLPCPTT